MKRFVICVIVMALLCSFVAFATSCSTMGSLFNKGKNSLQEQQTRTNLPDSFQEAKARMVAVGYDAEYHTGNVPDYGEGGYLGYFTAIKGHWDYDSQKDEDLFTSDYSEFFAEFYETEAQAKARFADEELVESFKNSAEFMEKSGKKSTYGQEGRWVYYGTKEALRAFKDATSIENKKTETSGIPTTLTDARKKLSSANFEVDVEDTRGTEYDDYGIIGFLYVNEKDSFLYGMLFESEERAARYFKEDEEDMLKGRDEAQEKYENHVVAAAVGVWCFMGTEDAVNALLG